MVFFNVGTVKQTMNRAKKIFWFYVASHLACKTSSVFLHETCTYGKLFFVYPILSPSHLIFFLFPFLFVKLTLPVWHLLFACFLFQRRASLGNDFSLQGKTEHENFGFNTI